MEIKLAIGHLRGRVHDVGAVVAMNNGVVTVLRVRRIIREISRRITPVMLEQLMGDLVNRKAEDYGFSLRSA